MTTLDATTTRSRSRRTGARTASTAGDAGPTQAIAQAVATLRFRALPAHVVERAKDLVLDHIGVTLYGACLPWSRKVREAMQEEGGRAQSTIYGGKRVPARAAALANGAAGHAIELDDTHDESLSHPGCVVLPATLAVAEARGASGRDVLAAMVAGYEAQCRIGAALGNDLIRRGFHPTATCGVYGAAAAAANLMRLDAASIVSAFGSGESMCSGVMQFTEDPAGTMIKRLHAGLPAERGVLAATLAMRGFAGPRAAVEGRWGFASVFAATGKLDRITEGLGERYEIERITVKLYPCCKLFHSLIEAIENCRAERPFTADEVVAIEPFGPRNMIDTHMEYRPRSTMAAQYSLPYACAAAIAADPTDPDAFAEDRLADKTALRIADLVAPVVDDALEAMFPRRFAGGVRIRLRDGKTLTSTVLDSRSSPEVPIGREEIQAKFRTLTNGLLTTTRQRRILETAARLDKVAAIDELTSLLRGIALPEAGTGTSQPPKARRR